MDVPLEEGNEFV